MRISPPRALLAPFLLGLAFALIGAWNLEAVMVGRGVISTFVGPVGLAVLFAALALIPERQVD